MKQPDIESRIVGEFVGYEPGRVYRLADGSSWRQEERVSEGGIFRLDPRCRVRWDQSVARWHLDVEGTGREVWVERWRQSWLGPEAF